MRILGSAVLFVDGSYLDKKWARKGDTGYLKKSTEEIRKQNTKVSPRVRVYVCVCVCVPKEIQFFIAACSNGQYIEMYCYN